MDSANRLTLYVLASYLKLGRSLLSPRPSWEDTGLLKSIRNGVFVMQILTFAFRSNG